MPGFEADVIRGEWANRRPKDIVVNNFGKSLLNLCFMFDCVILNSDRSGEYTYVSPHGSSVIDYFRMSEDLFSANCNLPVGDRVDSCHMPVKLILILMPTVKCVTQTGPKLGYRVSGPGESTRMTKGQREMCPLKCSIVWMVTPSSLRLFQSMVEFLYSTVFKESTLKHCELFLA